jgi:hypothetical protein
MLLTSAGAVISSILRHDAKTASYKIALIRGLNDVILGYPNINPTGFVQIAVPLRLLAEFWIAYFWPFVGKELVLQGRPQRDKSDISFRSKLTELRKTWETLHGASLDSDGYYLVAEMRSHYQTNYPEDFVRVYSETIKTVIHAIQQPIRYAGPGEWTVFPRPQRWGRLQRRDVTAIPGTNDDDVCLLVPAGLWYEFLRVSLWVEALCIHEWALFTESLTGEGRGKVYEMLTARPDNRRPLTWERNHIELLMMEGHSFICPWTDHVLSPNRFDLDHLIPLAVYPINEMWNLVPSEPNFNRRIKKTRLPSDKRLGVLPSKLAKTYEIYCFSDKICGALKKDSLTRFGRFDNQISFQEHLAHSVTNFIQSVRDFRNVAEF